MNIYSNSGLNQLTLWSLSSCFSMTFLWFRFACVYFFGFLLTWAQLQKTPELGGGCFLFFLCFSLSLSLLPVAKQPWFWWSELGFVQESMKRGTLSAPPSRTERPAGVLLVLILFPLCSLQRVPLSALSRWGFCLKSHSDVLNSNLVPARHRVGVENDPFFIVLGVLFFFSLSLPFNSQLFTDALSFEGES